MEGAQGPRSAPWLWTRPLSHTSNFNWGRGPIVWAVDVFADPKDYAVQLATAADLRRTFPDREIHPVYVLCEEFFSDRLSSSLRPALKPLALKSLRALVEDAGVELARKPRVLLEKQPTRAAAARKLLRYSTRVGASLLALAATQRSRFTRFFASSFSELVLESHKLPLLLAGPEAVSSNATPRVIVFPTDFSSDCRESYPEILSLAASLGAELHLFHKTVHVVDPIVQSGVNMLGGGWVSVEAYMNPATQDHTNDAQEWLEQAEQLGVQARFISENFREPTCDAIVEYVSKLGGSAPLVAMVSRSGPVASWLLGSVTRDVLKMSPAPVYIAAR